MPSRARVTILAVLACLLAAIAGPAVTMAAAPQAK
jgi:hypothetical protein